MHLFALYSRPVAIETEVQTPHADRQRSTVQNRSYPGTGAKPVDDPE